MVLFKGYSTPNCIYKMLSKREVDEKTCCTVSCIDPCV